MMIQSGIFWRDSLYPQQIVLAMMPQNYILRKCKGSDNFQKSQEKINNYLYMDDIKIIAKNKDRNHYFTHLRVFHTNTDW